MQKSVLIVTHGVDDHAPLVSVELEKLGSSVVWFDTDQYQKGIDLAFEVNSGTPAVRLRVGVDEYSGDAFSSVLFRHIRLPTARHIVDPEARRMAESELRATLEGGLLALEPAIWVNHPYANRAARNKLLQLRLASELGFAVPETRVTSDPQEIRRAYVEWDGRMVAKLVGGQLRGQTVDTQYVIYTTQLKSKDLDRDSAFSACPAIYQRLIEKQYELRVTVVGEEVFACRINSQAHTSAQIDWRAVGYDAFDLEACQLEASVTKSCRALLRALHLEIGGIDLIVTPQGETVFLEINAAGQWAFVQEATGLPIAAAIARLLASCNQTTGRKNLR